MAGGRISGITIEIGGNTKPLQKALKGVNGDIRTTQSQLKDVEKLLKLDPTNTELLKQKQQLLGKAVEQTKDKLDQLKEAQAQMDAQGVDKSSEAYMGLQREIIETEHSLKELEKAAKNSNVALDKIAATADKVGAGAQKVAEKTRALSTAAAGALTAIGGLAIKSAATADDLNTMAKQTGFSTAELQKMQYASDRIDVSMETIASASAKLTKKMASGSSAFEDLGVRITNADGSMRSSTEVFYDTIEALSGMENETERDAAAMEIFGKSATELSGVIDDGGAALKEYGEEAEKAGLILSQETLDGMNEINDEIDRLKAKGAASLVKAGSKALKALTPVIEKVVSVGEKVLDFIANLSPEQMKVATGILAVVAAISPVASIVSKVSSAVSGATKVLKVLKIGALGPIPLIIAAVVAAGILLYKNWDKVKAFAIQLKDGLVTAWNNIKTATVNAWNAVKTAISTAFNAAKQAVTTVIDAIKSTVSNTWNAIKTATSTAWNAVKTAISTAFTAAKQAVSTVINAIKTTVSNTWNVIKSTTAAVWAAIQTAISNPVLAAKTIVTTIVNGILTAVSNSWNTIRSVTSAVWAAIQSAVSAPIAAAKAAVTTAVNGIKTKLSSTWSAIKSNVSSAWNGIKSAITKPIDEAKSKISRIIDKIKGFFPLKLTKIFEGFKLPKINISGGEAPWGIGGKGVKPTFSLSWEDWYARAMQMPRILQGAQIFGSMNGHLIGGGESGREIIMSYDKLRRMMGGGGTTINVTVNAAPGMDERAIADVVSRRLQQQVDRRKAVWA